MWRRIAPAERDPTALGTSARPSRVVVRTLAGACLVLLPIAAWLARAAGAPRVGDGLALAAIAAVVIAAGRALGMVATTALGALVIVLVMLARAAGVPPVYGPPIVINLAVATFFGLSLRTANPLVTRFARAEEGTLTPAVERYCRRLTLVWTLYLGLLGAIGIAIAVSGDERWGAWWSGLLDYVLVAALFLGEMLWRRGSLRGIAQQLRSVRTAMRPPAS
jgi:uncharacterized membrane protein